MMLGVFGGKDLEEFARGLAKELQSRVPPDRLRDGARSKADASFAKALQHVTLVGQEYGRSHKVSVLKQIRISKVFQDELGALGYESDFIKEMTLTLARAMRVKKR